jgi:hypothetical protein
VRVFWRRRKGVARIHGFFVEEQLQHGNWRHLWLGKVELRDRENGEEWQRKGMILLLGMSVSWLESRKDDLWWMWHQ